MKISLTFADADVDTEVELDVATEDSELPDSEPGDPGRVIFLRLRGRPFNFGAAKNDVIKCRMESFFFCFSSNI